MEVVGAASSIIAVLQITASVIRVSTEYIRDVKGATKSAESLRKELRDFRGILEEVEEHAETERASGSAAEMKFLKAIEEPLAERKLMLIQTENKLVGSGKVKTLGKALLWPFKEKENERIIVSLRSFKESFHLALSLDSTALVKDIWRDVKDLSLANDDKHKREVLKWLDAIDTGLNHSMARKKHHHDTGAWFVDSEDFTAWCANPGAFMWLYGIPGCGKTVLSSSVIEALKAGVPKGNLRSYAVAYFYFDFNDAKNRTIPNFLSSVLAQLCQCTRSLPASLKSLHKACTEEGHHHRPSSAELLHAILDVSRQWHNVYLVVDALDECRLDQREDLLQILQDIYSADADIRLAITSRPEGDIKEALEDCVDTSICLQADNIGADISLYVQDVIRKDLKMRRWPSSDKQIVEHTLIERAQGMFRWVFCQIETLRKCMNRAAIHKTLQSLPQTLDQTYERTLQGIEAEYKQQAVVALNWLVFARRPLQLGELAEAVAMSTANSGCLVFDPEERLFKPELILDICSSLVSASGTGPEAQVRLAHFSVQEYLISDRIRSSQASDFVVTPLLANQIIANFCVSYLLDIIPNSGSVATNSDLIDQAPLLAYSVEFWYQHANSTTSHTQPTSELIIKFLRNDGHANYIQGWWELASVFRIGVWYDLTNLDDLRGGIAYAAYLGLLSEVSIMLRDIVEGHGRTALLQNGLYGAARGKHLDVVELLLDEGAMPDAEGDVFGTALQAAARSCEASVVKALLERGADPNIQGGAYGSPLQAAAFVGCKEAVKLLIDAGANVNLGTQAREESCSTPLQAAVHQGDRSIASILLDNGADPDAKGGKHAFALQIAAYRSSKDMVELLIDNGANPNAEGGQYGSALQASTHWGDIEIVRLLLHKGADPDIAGGAKSYGTALQAAANWGTRDIVELLLQHGANPNAAAGQYGSALEAATYKASRDIVEILLNYGASLDMHDDEYNDALRAAADRSSKEVVDLLLDRSANPNADTGAYGKSVQLASLRGYQEGARLLKDGSLHVEGLSARHFATLRLHHYIAEILPGRTTQPKSFSDPFTPMHWAAWNGHSEVIHRLHHDDQRLRNDSTPRPSPASPPSSLSKPASSFKQTHSYSAVETLDWSPLHVAIFRGHVEAVRAICDARAFDSEGGHPELTFAAMAIIGGAADLPKEFLSFVYRNLGDSLQWTIFHVAAMLGQADFLQYIAENFLDANIDMSDLNGMTALHWVAAAGDHEIVNILLRIGANASTEDDWGRRPADIAAGSQRMDVIYALNEGDCSEFPTHSILSHGINCASWRVCDSCDAVFQHEDLFLHCEACNDLDLCEQCLVKERGCKDQSHDPELWELHARMASLSKRYKSVDDVLSSREAPQRSSATEQEIRAAVDRL